MQTSALARYCLRFSLTSGDPSILSREELLDAAKNHFNGMVCSTLCIRFSCFNWDLQVYGDVLKSSEYHMCCLMQDLDEQSTVQEFVVAIRQQLTDGYKNYEMELRDE